MYPAGSFSSHEILRFRGSPMPAVFPRQKVSKPRRKPAKPKCDICAATGAETFRFMRRTFVFDVDRAREIVADGRSTWEMLRADVRFEVNTSRIHDHHVPHVKVRFPGIVARVRVFLPDGTPVEGDLLIDGHHRAAKCLRLNRVFSAYRLTVEETDKILIKRPDRSKRRAAR